MNIDLYILTFSAVTVAVTIWMGFRSAKKSKTASDFFVAGRSVSVGWNASAISGEYLSAASFMGIAGMVMSSGYDALWYPVCYACGYLFLLLFIAGPLRRFGAYTIPDFAEGRFDSPVFRKIAVVFVLFIGFFYTMPQMKGAGTTLAYIFPGLPYWAGVVLVGAVITLNVALGGMKGITLVQAFQYWAKMFAISVPIFVLMAVYGHYGKQVGVNGTENRSLSFQSAADLQSVIRRMNDGSPGLQQIKFPSRELRIGEVFKRPRFATTSIQRKLGLNTLGDVGFNITNQPTRSNLSTYYAFLTGKEVYWGIDIELIRKRGDDQHFAFDVTRFRSARGAASAIENLLRSNGTEVLNLNSTQVVILNQERLAQVIKAAPTTPILSDRQPLPAKAPRDETWLNPFGPLTTKAAKTAAAAIGKKASREAAKEAKESSPAPFANFAPSRDIPLRPGLAPDQRMTVALDSPTVAQALGVYAELTGRQLLPNTNSLATRADDLLGGKLSALKIISRPTAPDTGVREHGDGVFTAAEVKAAIEAQLSTNGIALVTVGANGFRVVAAEVTRLTSNGKDQSLLTSAATAEKAWLAKHEKPLALLYTYSLIIAIVCGTAGLPHILVRFYTNPDGAAAKRTTMWVMILIGVFYVFPPVFGALGRNLLPDLYNGVGAKGTDKIVLELPRLLNAKYPPLGSILSGITCAGAFAAFMSTFSGLLVSMTGALAHDVYGRILRPKSTPEERMRMFKWCAVLLGGVAVVLGSFVEPLEINFMVGQAFAIAAASYFPLLFMSVWWRGMTMKGAAIGMLTGGTCALFAVALTNFSNLALDKGPMGKIFAAFAPLNNYWADHPLLRILCEQPAIWTVPLAITLMIVVSKLTRREVPADSRMKMLVLHAPEELGLKQEYIQEHQQGH